MASPYDNIPGKIFIGGIAPITSQETIQKYFERYGELCDCVLMQDKTTGKSRGFGFVTYKDAWILDEVLSKPHIIDGKEVDCKRAIPRDQQVETVKEEGYYRTKKLFVGGLPQTTTEEQFKGYFEQFGSVDDSVIMVDKETGKSRGFGFVTFDSEDAVERVIAKYYDNKIDGKWVECKRAQPKESGSNSRKGSNKSKQDWGKESPINLSALTNLYNASTSQGQGGFYQSPTIVGSPSKNQKLQQSQDEDEYAGHYYGTGFVQNQMSNNSDHVYNNAYSPGTNTLSSNSSTFNPSFPNNFSQPNFNPNYPATNYGMQYQSPFPNNPTSYDYPPQQVPVNNYQGYSEPTFNPNPNIQNTNSHSYQFPNTPFIPQTSTNTSNGTNSVNNNSNINLGYHVNMGSPNHQGQNTFYPNANQGIGYNQGYQIPSYGTTNSSEYNSEYSQAYSYGQDKGENFDREAYSTHQKNKNSVQNMNIRETSRFSTTAITEGSEWNWNNKEVIWK